MSELIQNDFHEIELSDKQKKLFENLRGTWFDIVTYLDEYDIIESLNALSPLAYGLCFHDKDINADGELKKPHTHIVLCFNTRKRASRLVKIFNTTQIRVIEYDFQLKGSFDYLTHENETDKVKYEKSSLVVYNLPFFENFNYCESSKDNSMDIITKIINKYPLRSLVKEYGKDFVYHYNCYCQLAMAIIEEEQYAHKLKLDPIDTDEIDAIDKVFQ